MLMQARAVERNGKEQVLSPDYLVAQVNRQGLVTVDLF